MFQPTEVLHRARGGGINDDLLLLLWAELLLAPLSCRQSLLIYPRRMAQTFTLGRNLIFHCMEAFIT